MPANDFNIGRDCQLVILHPLAVGGRLILSIVTDFDSKPNYKSLNVDGLDGVTHNAELPQHWDITFGMSRGSAAVDSFIAALDVSYYTLGLLPTGTVYQYIQEVAGNTSTFQYNTVAFKLTDAGNWKGDTPTTQKLAGRCSRRIQVS